MVNKSKFLITLSSFVILCILPQGLAGQVTAGYTASDTAGCTPLVIEFSNIGSSGPGYEYMWYFGSLATSTEENPNFNFINSGEYSVKQVITNTSTLEKDSAIKIISVTRTPNASLIIDSSNACVGGIVEFRNSSTKDAAFTDFGDGKTSNEFSNYIFHAYATHGSYPVQYIAYFRECSDTSNYTVTVDGPIAKFSTDPNSACKGTPVLFTLGDTTDVKSFFWSAGDGTDLTGDSAVHVYDTVGYLYPQLTVNGTSGSCTIEDTLLIHVVLASFTAEAELLCDQETVFFQNTSAGNTYNYWNYGNGNTSSDLNGTQTYAEGSYSVSLKVVSNQDCSDSTTQQITIHPKPLLEFGSSPVFCPGESVMLSASGGHIILWYPADDFDDPTSFTPSVTPEASTSYTATITDTITHCSQSGEIEVYMQEGFIAGKITVFPADTSIIIGDTVQITVYDSLNRELIYTWTPDVQISCTGCSNPVIQPLQTSTYLLEVTDTNQCFSSELFEVAVEVTEEYRLGLPEAFTPNGDGVNDEIRVNGWGIKQLLEFRIYNRWGNEVFFTDDIHQGWDGNFNGKPQGIDSYAYVIRAEMWNNEIRISKGTFSLLR